MHHFRLEIERRLPCLNGLISSEMLMLRVLDAVLFDREFAVDVQSGRSDSICCI